MELRTAIPMARRAGGASRAAPPAAGGSRPPRRFLRGRPPGRASLRWPLLGLVALGLGLLTATTLLGDNGIATHRRLVRDRATVAAEVERLRAQRRELQTRIDALNTSPAALERIAREKYGMKRPGEEVIELIGGEQLTADMSATLAPAAPGERTGPVPARRRPDLVPAFTVAPPAAPTAPTTGGPASRATAAKPTAKPARPGRAP
ncbi:MAG: FtsB family cell division protein [Candidatus Krumholzibacteriia bacterium]